MSGRKRITVDMIEAAERKGWNAAQTARHYGMHRKSIEAAAERFGIFLPLGQSWTPTAQRLETLAMKAAERAEATQPVSKPVWSCSEASIKRALAKLEAQKKAALAAT